MIVALWIIGIWLLIDLLIVLAAWAIRKRVSEAEDGAYLDQVFADMDGEQFEREYRQFLIDSGLPQ